jgi:hypothetical protein
MGGIALSARVFTFLSPAEPEWLPWLVHVPTTMGGGCTSVFEVAELSTVYLEHPMASPFVTDQARLVQFSETFTKLSAVALPPVELEAGDSIRVRRNSLGLLQRILYEL